MKAKVETETRMKIAEILGWSQVRVTGRLDGRYIIGYPPRNAIIGHPSELPKWTDSIEAMMDAEKSLTEEEWRHYAWHLTMIGDGYDTWKPDEFTILQCWEMSLWDVEKALRTSAEQRALAFIAVKTGRTEHLTQPPK